MCVGGGQSVGGTAFLTILTRQVQRDSAEAMEGKG